MAPSDRKTNKGDALRDGAHPLSCLAPREYEVARLRLDGLSAVEVAEKLGIKPTSVRTTMHRVYQKCGVYDLRGLQAATDASHSGCSQVPSCRHAPEGSRVPQANAVDESIASAFLMMRTLYSMVAPAFIFLAFFAPAAFWGHPLTDLAVVPFVSIGVLLGLATGHALDALVARPASRGFRGAYAAACTTCYLVAALVAAACAFSFIDSSWLFWLLPPGLAFSVSSRAFFLLAPLVVTAAAPLGDVPMTDPSCFPMPDSDDAPISDARSSDLPFPLLCFACVLVIAAAAIWIPGSSSFLLAIAMLSLLASAACVGARLAASASCISISAAADVPVGAPSVILGAPSPDERRARAALVFASFAVGFYAHVSMLPRYLVMLDYLQACTLVAFAVIGAWRLWSVDAAASNQFFSLSRIAPRFYLRIALFVLASLLLTPIIAACLLAMMLLAQAHAMLAPAQTPRAVCAAVVFGALVGIAVTPSLVNALLGPMLENSTEIPVEFLTGAALLTLSLLGLAAYWWASAQAVNAHELRVLQQDGRRRALSESADRARAFLTLRGLNEFQVDVALMTAAGETVDGIAGELNYSSGSVKAARLAAYRVCGVHGASGLHRVLSQVDKV